MKKIVLPFLVSVIFIAGCGQTPLPPAELSSTILETSTSTSVTMPVSNTINDGTSDQNLSELDAASSTNHSFTLSNLHFTLPNKYTLKKIVGNTVYIRTDDTKHEVYLKATITSNTAKLTDNSDTFIAKDGAHITELGQDGVFALYQVEFKNKSYSISWEFQSNEPQSADSSESEGLGINLPETKVTNSDIVNIMKSIESAK
jgi:hypothetical protein